MSKLRILHFGSGGGKGVTRVLTDLGQGHAARGVYEPLIVFRRKRGRPVGEIFQRDLEASGVPFCEVSPRPKFRTVPQLRALIREFRPDVFVAHGYSDHLWGRFAALAEGVPVVVHVEHAHEHYKWLHLWHSHRLSKRTDAIVGVSRGVVERLSRLGFPAEKLHVVHNGVRIERFTAVQSTPWTERESAVVMASRFGRPKDQCTLIRAAALLRDRGTPVRVRFAGGGRKWELWRAKWLVRWLGLGDWVEFLGPRRDLPEVFRRHQVAVLSSRCEGFGLVVAEAMAAGCAVVGSRAPGIEELIEDGRTGWLAATGDAAAFADAIVAALGPEGAGRAAAGAVEASARFGVGRMAEDYERLFDTLLAAKPAAQAQGARVHVPVATLGQGLGGAGAAG